jgi:hypothetical protein
MRPVTEVKSLNRDFDHQTKIINKLQRSWWLTTDADLNMALIIIYGLLCTGYGKLDWNANLRNGEGDFELVPLGPTDVLPLGAKYSLETASCVIFQSVMPLHWFRQKYPIRGALVKPDATYSRYDVPQTRPAHIAPMLYDMLSPQMKRIVGQPTDIGTSAFPKALYREFWFKDYRLNTSNQKVLLGPASENWGYWVEPGKELYPRGRLIVMGGDVILYDGPNPYWHAKPPFAALRLNVVPWQWQGLSEMKPLVAMQDIINNILAGVMDMVKKAVNPVLVAPKNALSENVWSTLDLSMPGARVAFSPISPHRPEFAPTPALQPFVLQVMQLLDKSMERSSGIGAISDMLKKKQVPAGDTMDQIRQTQQTPIRLKGRNIEVFLRQIGSMSIPNIFQFYSKKRRISVLGEAGTVPEDFDYDPDTMVPGGQKPEDHMRNFVFEIQAGSLLSAQRVEKALLYMNLNARNKISTKSLYNALELDLDYDVEIARIKQEMAEFPPPPPQKKGGKQPQPVMPGAKK